MKVMQISVHFHPNLGGVESHLVDLVKASEEKGYETFVLTYMPLTTNAHARIYENNKKTQILRIPWLPGYFYKLVNKPVLEFIYLVPGLFILTPLIIFLYRPKVLHGHGLVAAFVAGFWGKVLFRKVVVSTHSLYKFPKEGLYTQISSFILNLSDHVLTLSKQSKQEIEKLGVPKQRVRVFTYWVDQSIFKPLNKQKSKIKLGFDGKTTILFVGRFVREKGLLVLLNAMKKIDRNIRVVIAGDGPLKKDVMKASKKYVNLRYVGRITQKKLPYYYSSADLVIVPSIHDEGFGRIILESLSCGTPVVASNRGGIKEAMNSTVGKLINVTSDNVAHAINSSVKNRKELLQKQKKAVEFARDLYSKKNFAVIINAYEN